MGDEVNENSKSESSAASFDGNLNSRDIQVRIACSQVVRDSLPAVSFFLGLLYLILAVGHNFLLTGQARTTMLCTAIGTALVMFLLRFLTGGKKFEVGLAHPVALLIAALVLVNATLHLFLTNQALQTTNFVLLVIGAGSLFLSNGYLLILVLLNAGCWLLIAQPYLSDPEWIHFGIGLLMATILAIVIHIARVRMILRNERLRRLEIQHRQTLEGTLETLKRREEQYADLFENANDLIQSVNAKGHFVFVNRRWKEVLGYNDQQLKKMTFVDILRKDHIETCRKVLQQLMQGETAQNIETVFLSCDGREIYVEGNINSQFQDGKFIATRGIFRDITERKHQEARMAELQMQLQNLNGKLAQAYEEARNEKDALLAILNKEETAFLLDLKGSIIGVSEDALALTGYSRLELVTKSIVDLLEPETRAEVVSVLKNGFVGTFKSCKVQFHLTASDFKPFFLNLNRINLEKERLILAVVRPA